MKRHLKRIFITILAVSMILGNSIAIFAEELQEVENITIEDDIVVQGAQTICAGTTSAAILEDGSLYTWGQNYYGDVGNGISGGKQLTPVKILSNAKTVCFGNFYGGAITEDGSLYMWGYNKYGQIGNGTTVNQLTPIKILSNVKSFSLNSLHSAAITEDGSLYMWGYNSCGQIGNGTISNQLTPVKILSDVVSVAVGHAHSAAITSDGSLYMWGANGDGKIGNGTLADETTENNQLTPVKILSDVVSVSLGTYHSAAITKDGSLYMWGANSEGEIGDGTVSNHRATPVKVLSDVVCVDLGMHRSAAITEDESLYLWGRNEAGQIGNGMSGVLEYQTTPIKVLSKVVSVDISSSQSGAITSDGSLYMWGDNEWAQIGNGTTINQTTPTKILSNVASVSIGGGCLAIKNDGNVYAWGNNGSGQVGNGTTTNQLTPIQILSGVRLPEKEQIKNPDVVRIYGSTRYETSYAISTEFKAQSGVEKFETVIVASGKNFPDALAGSYLAGVKDAPILMASEKNIDTLQAYIEENLQPSGNIYVLGGTGAVPDSVIAGLSEKFVVQRLAGESRYETNLLILEEAGVADEDILVCTGKGFADSLSASATGKPILLVNNKELTDGQKAFLEEHTGNQYYIIGGESAVNSIMEAEIQNYGETERIYGASRYETSVKVAEEFFENPEAVVLAYAKNFPDGLCGGPLAMSLNAPLILTATGKTDAAEAYMSENGVGVGLVLGGESLISNRAVNKMF